MIAFKLHACTLLQERNWCEHKIHLKSVVMAQPKRRCANCIINTVETCSVQYEYVYLPCECVTLELTALNCWAVASIFFCVQFHHLMKTVRAHQFCHVVLPTEKYEGNERRQTRNVQNLNRFSYKHSLAVVVNGLFATRFAISIFQFPVSHR